LLLKYPWPGTVRELRTAIEHAVVLSRGDRITPRDLPPWVRNLPAPPPEPQPVVARDDLTVRDAEKELIIRALKETDGNRTLAAKKLGMSRRTLHRKLHEYHLENF
jgi:DNA-binding NtrC family response regulator